jgi:DNA polymerase-3 subunit alpha
MIVRSPAPAHSEYSLLDGGNRLDKLVKRVKELGMHAVAVTDHGNMHAAVNFYSRRPRRSASSRSWAWRRMSLPGEPADRTYTGVSDGGYHLVLLAENRRVGQPAVPVLRGVPDGVLLQAADGPGDPGEAQRRGLIAINGHLGRRSATTCSSTRSRKDRAALEGGGGESRGGTRRCSRTGNGAAVLHRAPAPHREQNSINPHLIRLARELDLPLVCDNDSHFLMAEDHDAHDTLICISTGKSQERSGPDALPNGVVCQEPEEMEELFEGDRYNNAEFGARGGRRWRTPSRSRTGAM